MPKELAKIYEPQKVEDEIYQRWEKSGFLNPDNIDSKDSYCNVLPPPNANGELHVGHASGYTVMDIFGRWARMNGKKTLLLPGKDHAGIQTQVVFEKILEKENGTTRQDIGRKDFYKKTYDFCIGRANYMRSQEKKIGISADWSREKFTLDPDVLKIALETFIKMHSDGLIYKGKRIINWCPRCATALSDVEVLHKNTAGKLYYIKYPLENSSDFITVATTRPETMLGDSAVAVNPEDARFSNLVGKNIILPLQNTTIPIIADKRIDQTFGTGAVKITPAHDPLDWEIGKDHNLKEIQVIDEQTLITELGGIYAGLNANEARIKIVSDLEKIGLLEKIEEMEHSVSICERCKTTIQPLTSSQWFINVDAEKYSLKRNAIQAIKKGEIEIFPENFKKILIDWFENMRDWCISRQIWWGPQFPIWYCSKCGEKKYIVSIEKPTACPHCKSNDLIQDENTFDTWFTSGQWAYTTLESHKDDSLFYPSDMMVMGRDLLFFWSSRMIMMSLYTKKEIPFKNLFFTGLVRDKEGHKFSKSRGNGIDPLLMIDKFGADALRMSLIMDSAPGQDSRLYEEKIENFRNFANKLWNISRFCFTQENFKLLEDINDEDILSPADGWIISNLEKTTSEITRLFESKQIAVAADLLKTFTWGDFADWYVEINKIEKNQKVLGYVLDKILRLWHPFMPFITEHIWTIAEEEKLLLISSWPKVKFDSKYVSDKESLENIKDLIIAIRNIRTENKIESSKKISITINSTDKKSIEILKSGFQEEIIKKLKTGVENISYNIPEEKLSTTVKRTLGKINIYLDLMDAIDNEKEKNRFEKEIANIEFFVNTQKARLANKDFVSKAPAKIIEQQKETLSKKEVELNELKKHLASLN
jgi:valyl-tRNA synthetase